MSQQSFQFVYKFSWPNKTMDTWNLEPRMMLAKKLYKNVSQEIPMAQSTVKLTT